METECYFCINTKKKFCVSVRKFGYYSEERVSVNKCSRAILREVVIPFFIFGMFVFEFENIAIVHNMVLNGSLSDAVVLSIYAFSVSSDTAASFLGSNVFAFALVKDVSALPRLWRNSLIKALAATNLKILIER